MPCNVPASRLCQGPAVYVQHTRTPCVARPIAGGGFVERRDCATARSSVVKAAIDDGPPGSSDDGSELDIDALAKRLSQEAERLRRTESGKEASSSLPASSSASSIDDPIFGPQALKRHAEFFASVEGGFVANEFEILQQLGRLSWVTESAKENPLQVTATTTEQVQAVVAFAARYYSYGPFQDPVATLLKEFLPAARPVGCNELQICSRLCGLPEMKWQAAVASLSANPPVVPILGFFTARQSELGTLLSQEDMQPATGQDALWLVYKWESLQPLSFYPGAEQTRKRSGFGLWGGDTETDGLKARCRMLRQICRGALQALAFCHAKGVSHKSLGSGSVLLNTFDDRRADSLLVKLTNFGFAQQFEVDEHPAPGVAEWQKEDLQAMGVVLLEVIFSALADTGPSQATTADALRRLLVEVFGGDVDKFRRYLQHEMDWTAPVALLDEFGASGWAVISALVAARATAANLVATNQFLDTQSL